MGSLELNGLSILVVDDEDGLREAVSMTLKSRGAQVTQAGGGRSAFELLKTAKFDWVVSDIRMPDGDGIALLAQIQTLPQNIPKVILVTGYADVTPDQALNQGAFALLPKPFPRQSLINLFLQSK